MDNPDSIDKKSTEVPEAADLRSEVRFELVKLFDRIFPFMLVFGCVTLAVSITRSIQYGWRPIISVYCAIFAVLITTLGLRRKLPLAVTSVVFLSVGIFDAIVSFSTFGLASAGSLLLVVSCVCAGIFYGLRAGLFTFGISMVVLVVSAVLVCSGAIPLSFDVVKYMRSPVSWSVQITHFALLSLLCIMMIHSIKSRLFYLFDKVRQRSSELSRSNELLTKEIASRIDAEQRRMESETQYRLLAENMNDVLFRQNIDHTITYVSPSAEKFFGYKPDEVYSLTLEKLLTPQSYVRVSESFRVMSASAAKGDVTVPLLELEYVRKDGSTFWGELHVNFLKDASGKLTGMQGVLRDISERRQSEKEFWALSLRNETILSSVPDIIMQVNDDKVYTWANPAGMEFFGPDVIGKEASYYFEGEQKTYEIVQPLFNGSDDVFYLESWQRRKDGIKRLLAWWCRALKDENGRVAGVLSTARDITEKERINAELQNAEKLKSIGALAGGIAHDFNNLLTGIFGYIQMASLNLPENSQAARDLKNATDVFSRAKSLTQQLLTFSKGGTPVKKNVSISIIIQETARFALSGSNVSAETDIPDDLWTCEADENQITQVIDNILINARQAMPLGGTIRMCASNVSRGAELTPLLSDKPYVKISIRDQGIGIQKEILPRIFDPFFTTKQQGSGLGLAMAYSIVKKHNGLIGVDSEPGKGTVFTIYLPASQWPIVKATPANVYSGKMGHRRVLFMDDEESICVAASVFLREIGCLVTIASGGRHAVELFKKARLDGAPFDLIILDLTIPGGMGGKQALEEIREIDASVNAVASSGYSDDPVMAEPEKFGFKAKIDKPYMKDDLQELVGNFPF